MNELMLPKEIIEKYNVPSPRYTSYPTILDWNQPDMDIDRFKLSFTKSFLIQPEQPASIYIHLPFCESLCTFCGCHKHITKNHSVEQPYIDALIKEWDMYETLAGQPIILEELHLGGGTPTFFSAVELNRLIQYITKNRTEKVNFSVEGHPNHTSFEQMNILFNLGFRRISFGVQDYDPEVQKAINRIQTFEQVKKVTEEARSIGFVSISHDLVFGLPKQTMAAMADSIEKTISVRPDNISLYSYAHVPWVRGTGQRGFSDADLPTGAEKRTLYEYAKRALLEAGYIEIGMDHFGLPTEPMTIAMKNQELNRNFMGYTIAKTERLIALGVSAISEYPFGYAQNVKSVKEYHEHIDAGEFPLFKGHFHSETDKELKHHIKELMCDFETTFSEDSWISMHLTEFEPQLNQFQQDGIINWRTGKINITAEGRPFVRNVCMMLDPYAKLKVEKERFSHSV
jgi:oxygen-independent coproporphyrinogen III oxidase